MKSTPSTTKITVFTAAERQSLRQLCVRYHQVGDEWGKREWAHLRYLRRLYQTGRLIP